MILNGIYKILEKLRQLPLRKRKIIAFIGAIIITLLFFLIKSQIKISRPLPTPKKTQRPSVFEFFMEKYQEEKKRKGFIFSMPPLFLTSSPSFLPGEKFPPLFPQPSEPFEGFPEERQP